MRRTAALIAALALLTAACGGDAEPRQLVENTRPEPEPEEPEPEPDEPEPEPEPDRFPLSGVPLDDAELDEATIEEILARPVVATKVDNDSTEPFARPQDGLEHADIVIVEQIEGATRFVVLYHSYPLEDLVGPIRSARMVESYILPAFTPLFMNSGAAQDVWDELISVGLEMHQEDLSEAWTRTERPRPYNLFLDVPAAIDLYGTELPAAEQPWPFAEEPVEGGESITRVDLVYPGNSGTFAWVADTDGRFQRYQDGAEHFMVSGEQISADTVIIASVNPSGVVNRPFDVVGEGELLVLRDGELIEGTWQKASRGTHYEWLDADGEPIPVKPGRTWIELVPQTGSIDPTLGPNEMEPPVFDPDAPEDGDAVDGEPEDGAVDEADAEGDAEVEEPDEG